MNHKIRKFKLKTKLFTNLSQNKHEDDNLY